MSTHILVAPQYGCYFKITPEQLAMLIESTQFKRNYDNGYHYTPTDEVLDIQIIGDKDIRVAEPVPELDVDAILAENNRLSRENELLQEKLSKLAKPVESECTELEPI